LAAPEDPHRTRWVITGIWLVPGRGQSRYSFEGRMLHVCMSSLAGQERRRRTNRDRDWADLRGKRSCP